ncbi:MAG: four helix bundle protein [Muribaculaceae bacterium]|nr:four helix bundle protein [Muribaculaceae bacterium]MDE5975840.1 four helix bundle protein [Muribaculaceae bacterium]MDE6298539.1 four helix bundle protein [Muribaculaceae bacterium]
MEDGVLQKSRAFALRIINMYRYLIAEHKEYVMSRQLLRSGTSIGANVTEAQDAQSGWDFVSKLQIALKEARETSYWIYLLYESDFIDSKMNLSITRDLNVIISLLVAIIKSRKQNLEKEKKRKQ